MLCHQCGGEDPRARACRGQNTPTLCDSSHDGLQSSAMQLPALHIVGAMQLAANPTLAQRAQTIQHAEAKR